jgi:hypothetical protein
VRLRGRRWSLLHRSERLTPLRFGRRRCGWFLDLDLMLLRVAVDLVIGHARAIAARRDAETYAQLVGYVLVDGA